MCQTGCPIRISPDQVFLADPRSFSQLYTSFVASISLGIPRAPLHTFFFVPRGTSLQQHLVSLLQPSTKLLITPYLYEVAEVSLLLVLKLCQGTVSGSVYLRNLYFADNPSRHRDGAIRIIV